MTASSKRFIQNNPHLHPPSPTLKKATRMSIAQQISGRRKDAKPPTIDTPPWEKEKAK